MTLIFVDIPLKMSMKNNPPIDLHWGWIYWSPRKWQNLLNFLQGVIGAEYVCCKNVVFIQFAFSRAVFVKIVWHVWTIGPYLRRIVDPVQVLVSLMVQILVVLVDGLNENPSDVPFLLNTLNSSMRNLVSTIIYRNPFIAWFK